MTGDHFKSSQQHGNVVTQNCQVSPTEAKHIKRKLIHLADLNDFFFPSDVGIAQTGVIVKTLITHEFVAFW